MFYTLDLRSARWWLVGILMGLMGWAIWSSVERSQPVEGPLAFERQFWPAQSPDQLPAMGQASHEPSAGWEPKRVRPGQGATARESAGSHRAAAPPEPEVAASAGSEAAGPPVPAVAGGPAGSRGGRPDADSLRAERERLRSREMELASQVLEDPNASDERKSQAQLELVQLLQRSRREVEIEQLLAAAGVEGSVVSIGEAGVQVVVAQPLTVQGAARIGELVARMAGVRRENISIIDSVTALAPAP